MNRLPYSMSRDPVFLGALALYGLGRLVLRPWLGLPWLDAYGNDVLLAGVVVPPITWARQVLGLRTTAGPPEGHEVVLPVLVIAVVFELIVPAVLPGHPAGYADPYDLAAYAAGAALALLLWRATGRAGLAGAASPPNQDRAGGGCA